MNKVKVVGLHSDGVTFDNGAVMYSEHERECCESHYLDFSDLTLADFEGLEFDISNDDFFERIEDYGIALKPLNGHPVRVPGYGSNNGYYSTDLDLVIKGGDLPKRVYDIQECQVVDD